MLKSRPVQAFLNPELKGKKMFIDTNNIGEKGLSIADSISIDENLLVEEGSFFLEDLVYDIRFIRDANKINVKGKIKTSISLTCVRCLEEFEFRVNSNFDVVLFPSNLVTSNNISLNDDDMEYIFYEDQKINLVKFLVEQVNLVVPLTPTCTPDCNGICPNCGTNLNNGHCKCENSVNELSILFNKLKR